MFDSITEATDRVRSQLARIDAAELDEDSAREMLSAFSGLANVAQAGQAVAAGALDRAVKAKLGSKAGRMASHIVSGTAGISEGAAESLFNLSAALEDHQDLKSLFVGGDLSAAEAKEIASALGRNSAAEEELLRTAKEKNFSKLRNAANSVQSPDPDADERRAAAARAGRRIRTWTDAEGFGHLKASGPTDVIGRVWSRIQAESDSLFDSARRAGVHQPPRSYAFDAFVALLTAGTAAPRPSGPAGGAASPMGSSDSGPACPSPAGSDGTAPADSENSSPAASGGSSPASSDRAQPARGAKASRPRVDMIIRADFSALVRGWPEPGEVCEIAGLGPVPVSTARSFLGDAALKFVITDGVDIRTIAHCGRHINAHLRTALAWKFRCCVEPGCGASLGTEIDHVHPVGKQGLTAWENLEPRCRAHHREKTARDYPNGTAAYRGQAKRAGAGGGSGSGAGSGSGGSSGSGRRSGRADSPAGAGVRRRT